MKLESCKNKETFTRKELDLFGRVKFKAGQRKLAKEILTENEKKIKQTKTYSEASLASLPVWAFDKLQETAEAK